MLQQPNVRMTSTEGSMKKLSAALLCLLIAATCVGCGNKNTTNKKEHKSASASTQTEGSGNTGSMTSSDVGSATQEHSDTEDTNADTSKDALTTAENTPTDNSSDSSLSADGISITYGDYVISVLSCEETTDINNCPALRATYSFTNNSTKQAAFSTTAVTYAYQNDYRLANSSPAAADEEYSAQLQLVDPGKTITCAAYYLLDNTQDDVRIEVTNLLNSSDDVLSLRYRFGGQTSVEGQ